MSDITELMTLSFSEISKITDQRDEENRKNKLLRNAITEALREVERCPDDSVVDIFNESLTKWETGLRMNRSYVIEDKE